MEYYYRVYGLRVKSEIELPEVYPGEKGDYDVEISYGVMPGYIKEKRQEGFNTSILLREYRWFYYENEGNFISIKGNQIIAELDYGADEKHVRALILGACLGSILYQKETLAIHGAAIVLKGKAVIICGCSGAGKSTVSMEFLKEGCGFLADDTVAIVEEEGIIYANPAYPQQKLCKDAVEKHGYNPKDLVLLEEEREKYAIGLKNIFSAEKKEVAALVYLSVHDKEELEIYEITNSSKLEYIISNLYTYYDFERAGMNTHVFKKCIEMAKKTPIIRVKRPKNKDMAPQITKRIIGFMEEMEQEKREILGG